MTAEQKYRTSFRAATLLAPVVGEKLTLFIAPKGGARILSAAFTKAGAGSVTMRLVGLTTREDTSGSHYMTQDVDVPTVVRQDSTISYINPNTVVILQIVSIVGIVDEAHVTIEWADAD